MSSGVKVDYTILDECIKNLKSISEGIGDVGEDNVQKLIFQLDTVFSGTNSDMANALEARRTEYYKVNNMLINLASNAVGVLEAAKLIYEKADLSMTAQIQENYGNQ